MEQICDIERNGFNFSDGGGLISTLLALKAALLRKHFLCTKMQCPHIQLGALGLFFNESCSSCGVGAVICSKTASVGGRHPQGERPLLQTAEGQPICIPDPLWWLQGSGGGVSWLAGGKVMS